MSLFAHEGGSICFFHTRTTCCSRSVGFDRSSPLGEALCQRGSLCRLRVRVIITIKAKKQGVLLTVHPDLSSVE